QHGRLPGAAGSLDGGELAGLDVESDAVDGPDLVGTAAEHPLDGGQGVEGGHQPTVLSASAGDMRAARQPPMAPAMSPPIRANAPPNTPMPSVSMSTWRTTIVLGHPMARSVPISRTRLATDDSVSSTAMAKAAISTITPRAPPSRLARFLASFRLPVT